MKIFKMHRLVFLTLLFMFSGLKAESGAVPFAEDPNFLHIEISGDDAFIVLALGEENRIIVFDTEKERIIKSISYADAVLNRSMPFMINPQNGELFVCLTYSNHTVFEVYDLKQNTFLRRFALAGEVQSFGFSSDNKHMAVSTRMAQEEVYNIFILDYASGFIKSHYDGLNRKINFSADNEKIAFFIKNPETLQYDKLEIVDFVNDNVSGEADSQWWVDCAFYSADKEHFDFGNLRANGYSSEMALVASHNVAKDKSSFYKTHFYYNRPKQNGFIKSEKKDRYCFYSENTNKSCMHLPAVLKHIGKSNGLSSAAIIFSAAFDFDNGFKHLIFPTTTEADSAFAVVFYDFKKMKAVKRIAFSSLGAGVSENIMLAEVIQTDKVLNDATFISADKEFEESFGADNKNVISDAEYNNNYVFIESPENKALKEKMPSLYARFAEVLNSYAAMNMHGDNFFFYQCLSNMYGYYEDIGYYNKSENFLEKMYALQESSSFGGFSAQFDLLWRYMLLKVRQNNYEAAESTLAKMSALYQSRFLNAVPDCDTYSDAAYYNAMLLYGAGYVAYSNPIGNRSEADSLLSAFMNCYEKFDMQSEQYYINALLIKGNSDRTMIDDSLSLPDNHSLFVRALEYFGQIMRIDENPGPGLRNALAMLYMKAPLVFDNKDSIAFYYSAAIEQLETASIEYRDLGTDNPDYLQSKFNEGICCLIAANSDFKNADTYISHAEKALQVSLEGRIRYFRENLKSLSEAEIIKLTGEEIQHNNSMLFSLIQGKNSHFLNKTAYNWLINTNLLAIKSTVALKSFFENNADSSTVSDYSMWLSLRDIIASQSASAPDKRIYNLDSLNAEANVYEKKLQKTFALLNHNSYAPVASRDIAVKLKRKDVVVEFVTFPFFNGIRFTDSIMYMAFVLKYGDVNPTVIPLFEQNELDALTSAEGMSDQSFVNGLYRGASLMEQFEMTKSTQLYDLVWKPLDAVIPPGSNVYFSPSGTLHQIAFSALKTQDGTWLSDLYTLNQLSTSAKLAEDTVVNKRSISDITLFGGIQYDQKGDERTPDQQESLQKKPSNTALPAGSTLWTYLPGTFDEVTAIKELAREYNVRTSLFTGTEAREEQLKKTGAHANPSVLHIATHGFFFPDANKTFLNEDISTRSGKLVFKTSDNPLDRSGLLFAGANHAWSGHAAPEGADDGILTAYEAASIYLGQTRLVVLSACETGLGDIKGSEGVFGLQRAFKSTGAEYLMMSLWQVPDKETSEFMTFFYTRLLRGYTIPDAFTFAQEQMKQKYYDEPYKWAAFVLVR